MSKMWDFRFYDNTSDHGICEIHLDEMMMYCDGHSLSIRIDEEGKIRIRFRYIDTEFAKDFQQAYDNYINEQIEDILLGEDNG